MSALRSSITPKEKKDINNLMLESMSKYLGITLPRVDADMIDVNGYL